MIRLVSTLLLFIYSLLAYCEGVGNNESVFENSIHRIMQDYEAVGISMVLVKENQISFSKSYGYKPNNVYPMLRDSIKKDDISWIASITKTFIATAIMQILLNRICGP